MQQTIPIKVNGRTALPGYRLKRLEMLNWGTFNGNVQRVIPDGRWTMLVGVNGTGKSTAADALRTLLVPPARTTYNDASIDHKLKQSRRDRTKRTYIRGAYGSSSQEDSATALTQYLRPEGVQSILLAVFTNEITQVESTLAQILWDQNDKPDQLYLVARSDKTIKEHLVDLGTSREMPKALRKRGFEVYNTFPGYEEAFRRLIGIPGAGALEVFNQAIGVKEVTDLNQFIRKHMLESANLIDFITSQIKPHYVQLNACWEAIKKAEDQLAMLTPLADNHAKMLAAQEARERIETLREQLPIYYAQQHFGLCIAHQEDLEAQISEKNATRNQWDDKQRSDEEKKQSLITAINNDETGRRLKDIDRDIKDAAKERDFKMGALERLKRHLGVLQHPPNLENKERFEAMRQKLLVDREPLNSNLGVFEQKLIDHAVAKTRAQEDRERIAKEAASVRDNKVLIPGKLVHIRSLIAHKTGVAESELPFAGELMEVKPEFKEWTGAIERVLHNFGTSLLVPDRWYFEVSKYINHHHLGTVLYFFRVPSSKPVVRAECLNDAKRIPFRMVFDESKPLAEWVKGELSRRFDHFCCNDIQSLSQVEFGVTKEGMIRNGFRHIKDDRNQINDRSNFVLGWNTQAKLAALMEEFGDAERKVKDHEAKEKSANAQVATTRAKLAAINEALQVNDFSQIDYRQEQQFLDQLHTEREQLRKSSNQMQELENQLNATEEQISIRKKQIEGLQLEIGRLQQKLQDNQSKANRLKEKLNDRQFDKAEVEEELLKLQDGKLLTLENIVEVETQVDRRLQGRSSNQLGIANTAKDKILVEMTEFLGKYPEETSDLKADITYGREFCSLKERVDQEQLPAHKERFFSLLNTNLIMDIAALNTKLTESESGIRQRIDSVNQSLKRIKFSADTYVQIIVLPASSSEVSEFRLSLKQCLAHGILPSAEAQQEIYSKIRELISRFDSQPEWAARVTDTRNWLEYGVKKLYLADNTEAEYYSASSGKSGGQKSLLAFTILASAITAQYGIGGNSDDLNRFRLVVVDEAFGKTDEENSQRALELFKELGLQLVVINPFDAKSRIVEDYVDSYHLVSIQDEVSSIRRASRAEYQAARDRN